MSGQPSMPGGDVRRKAVRGIAWTVAIGLATRILQTLGTLALTHFLQRDAVGEVTNAAIVAMSAHTFTTLGIPHYLVNRKGDRAAAWHATVILGVTGLVAFTLTLLFQAPLAAYLKSPGLGRYLPLLVLSAALTRIVVVPERLLHQRLLFAEASRARGAGELTYTVVSVVLAVLGEGGMAIVAGNLARAVVCLVGVALVMPLSEWATPQPFDRRLVREMLAYGLPLGVALLLGFAARNWDNGVVSALFGAAVVGAYNLAYNLADIPASQIAEQAGDVLSASFARLDAAGRKAGLLRSTALLGLLSYPLAIGLGLVGPELAAALLGPSWAAVGPMLTVLSLLSFTRPIGWTVGSYLQITQRTAAVMWLSALRLGMLLVAVALLGRAFGPLGACAGVGVAFGLHAFFNVVFVVWKDHLPASKLLAAMMRPLLACAPLAVATLAAQAALSHLGVSARGVGLVVQVAAGALGYALGVYLFARDIAADLRSLARELRARRAGGAAAPGGGGDPGQRPDPVDVGSARRRCRSTAEPRRSRVRAARRSDSSAAPMR